MSIWQLLYFILWSIALSEEKILPMPIKSPNDDRTYHAFVLDNQMKVLLISDNTTDEAAVSLSVNVGSWSDPPLFPGLAHFCEHMLFMGTEPYPSETEFDDYLGSHNGWTNAYTSQDITNYYFGVQWVFLNDTLDRFAPWFKSPLFKESAVLREINAVNNEWINSLQHDGWRSRHMATQLSDPQHFWHKFTIGNNATLNKQGIHNVVKQWYYEHYSSNNMALVVAGRETIAELKDLVRHHFDSVPNRNINTTIFTGDPYAGKYGGKLVQFKPLQKSNYIMLWWVLPSEEMPNYDDFEASSMFIDYLFTTNAPGTLMNSLISKGWINSINSGIEIEVPDISLYTVSIELTDEGMSHQKEILEATFQYLHLIEAEGLNDDLWDEWLDFLKLDFRFQQKEALSDVVGDLSPLFFSYPSKYLLEPPSKYHFNKTTATFLLENIVPSKIKIMMDISQMIEGPLDLTEPIYDIQYSEKNLSNSPLIRTLVGHKSTGNYSLSYNRSEFLPTVFDLVGPQPLDKPVPRLIKNKTRLRVWWKRDDIFATPTIQFRIRLYISKIFDNEFHFLSTQLYISLVEQAMEKIDYKTSQVGYTYSLSTVQPYGLELSVSGYSEKFSLYLSFLVDAMYQVAKDPLDDITTFNRLKQNLIDKYANVNKSTAWSQSFASLNRWIEEKSFQNRLLYETSSQITTTNFETFTVSLFDDLLFAESFGIGNLVSEDVITFTDLITNKFTHFPFNNAYVPIQNPIFLLPCGSNYIHRAPQLNPDDLNSASYHVFQMGLHMDAAIFAKASLIDAILDAPVFNVLRAEEQLGYSAWNRFTTQGPLALFWILVQGSNYVSEYVDQRIDVFLLNYYNKLQDFTESELELYKSSLSDQWLEKKLTLSEKADGYWDLIQKQNYNFNQISERIAALDLITLKDITAFYHEKLISTHTRRRVAFATQAKTYKGITVEDNVRASWKNNGTAVMGNVRDSWKTITTSSSPQWDISICVEDGKSYPSKKVSKDKDVDNLSSSTGNEGNESSSMKNCIQLTAFILSLAVAYIHCII